MWRDLNITKQDWERAPAAVRTVLLSLQQQGRLLLIRCTAYEKEKSFGTQSESGSRFVERILTVVTTLRQQGRDVLGYLTTVGAVASVSASSPCLLPDSS